MEGLARPFEVGPRKLAVEATIGLAADDLDAVSNDDLMCNASLDESGLEPSRLTLQVTESVIVENVAQAVQVLTELREMGVKIASSRSFEGSGAMPSRGSCWPSR